MRASMMSRSIPAALIGASLAVAIPASARANVITDWDEKAIAAVTPMASLGGTSPYMAVADDGDGPRRDVRRGQFDRAALPTVSGAAACGSRHVKGSRRRRGGRCGPGDNRCKDGG